MSIYTALRAGVSGLTTQSSALAVISDNIANVNTTAYKRGISHFSALVNGQNQETTYNAGGVVGSMRRVVSLQGSLEQSRSPTDLAISGQGFFIVAPTGSPLTEGGDALFTRAGSFSVDYQGLLRNAQGYVLQGWPVESDGSVRRSPTSLSALLPVSVADVGAVAEATTEVSINANLLATQDIYNSPVVTGAPTYALGRLTDGTITPHYETTVEVFDSFGAARTLAVGFLKTAANQWTFEVYASPADTVNTTTHPGGRVAEGVITFGADGSVASINNQATPAATFGPFTITWDADSGAAAQPIELDLRDAVTQFALPYSVKSVTTDGVPPGELVGLVLEGDGYLTAQFSNGRSRSLYQVPLATFLDPNALAADQRGAYRTTLESGSYTINGVNSGGAGVIESGVLEASNVDLAAEFTSLITTQRAYSASSRIITTADQMLEELLAIKR